MSDLVLEELLNEIIGEELIDQDCELVIVDSANGANWLILGIEQDGYNYFINKELNWSRVKQNETSLSIEELMAYLSGKSNNSKIESCLAPFNTQLLINVIDKFNQRSDTVKMLIDFEETLGDNT